MKITRLKSYAVPPRWIFLKIETDEGAIPTRPGLGIEINEKYVTERAKVGHRWRNPIWRHADGSLAEW